jgi:NADPH:quinone reductase-like Zn-dependent oxidoreductase
VPGPDDVLVEVEAAGLNLLDSKIRNGEFKPILPYKPPLVLGHDLAGTVAKVGAGVRRFKPGDAVYARPRDGQIGAFAHRIVVKNGDLALKPANLSMAEAASIPLVGLTAWQVLVERAQIKPGQKVLIHAGSGGVGTFAIQLAKHLGARVITTASAANLPYLRDIGADQVIDYNTTDFTKAVKNVDAVFDTVGGDVATRSFAVLKPGGRAAFIASGSKAPTPERSDVTSLRPIASRDRPVLERVAALYQAGVIRKPEVKLYKLSQAAEAHRVSEGRHLRGKLVFKLR